MLCEKCKKNIASIHFQRIINGQKTEYHVCKECAEELEINNLSFNDMFKGFLDGFMDIGVQNSNLLFKEVCQSCGNSLLDFKNYGKLGCSKCYETFENQIDDIIRSIQGNCQHTGKVPKRIGNYTLNDNKELSKLDQLKQKLQEAIKNEEYEQAASIRDEIKKIQGGNENE